jgi:hypothetical protein
MVVTFVRTGLTKARWIGGIACVKSDRYSSMMKSANQRDQQGNEQEQEPHHIIKNAWERQRVTDAPCSCVCTSHVRELSQLEHYLL